jgi:hypothetical protein
MKFNTFLAVALAVRFVHKMDLGVVPVRVMACPSDRFYGGRDLGKLNCSSQRSPCSPGFIGTAGRFNLYLFYLN